MAERPVGAGVTAGETAWFFDFRGRQVSTPKMITLMRAVVA